MGNRHLPEHGVIMNIFGGGHAASDPGEIILDLEQEWKDMHMLVCNRDMCIFTGELENIADTSSQKVSELLKLCNVNGMHID